MRKLVLLALAVWSTGALHAQEPARPRLSELRVVGASAYDQARVLRLLRLRTGASLPLEPERLAELVEQRYRDDGYVAARVRAEYTPEGVLTLSVDEGRLGELLFPTLSPAAQARATRALGLEPQGPLREADIAAAWARLDKASQGALVAGTHEVTAWDPAARLELRPEVRRLARGLALHGPHSAGYYNRVDGLNLGATLELRLADLTRYEHTHLSLAASYGSAAKTWRTALGVARPLLRARLWLGYEWHDLSDRDDAYRLVGLDEASGTSVLERSLSDLYRRRGHEAYAFVRLSERAQLGLAFRADRYESLELGTDGNPFGGGSPRPNPAIDQGDQRSLLVSVRWAKSQALFSSADGERRSYLQRSLWGSLQEPPSGLRFEATLERATLRRLEAADSDFTRLSASLRGRHALVGGLRLDTRVLFGWGSEGLPLQRRLVLGGEGSLRGYPLASFSGERLLVATGELSLQPLGRGPRLIGFYDAGGTWSRVSGDSGFKSDWGLGLRFPADGSTFVRFELSRPIGGDAARATRRMWRLQLPL